MNLPHLKRLNSTITNDLNEAEFDLAIVLVDEKEINNKEFSCATIKELDNTKFNGTLIQLLAYGDFEGKWLQNSISLIKNTSAGQRVLLLGTGKKHNFMPARARQLGLKAAEISINLKANKVQFFCLSVLTQTNECIEQARLGFSMGIYKYPNSNMTKENRVKLQHPLNVNFISRIINCPLTTKKYDIITHSLNICRLLQDGPPNVVNPKYVAENILAQAQECGVQASVFGAQKLRELGFGAMMAVASGSAQEPQFIILEYKPENFSKTLAFVGKGLTMDTGGYSIKTPSVHQESMKYDMSGAAVSLSAILAIAKLKLPIHVYAIGAMCENMIDAHAYRVGDILTSYCGKTIEIIDTDAEGRIVLSDALHYAAKDLKADYIVEYSTLTGAVVVALGHVAAGVFAFDSHLEEVVLKAAEHTGERVHSMPVYEEIADEIKGTISDLVNVSAAKRSAGSMFAAAFLKEFVNDVPYVHIDIAGVADNNKAIGYPNRGSSGYGVQLAVEIAKQLAHEAN